MSARRPDARERRSADNLLEALGEVLQSLAALVAGGIVFAIALVLPGLVSLRGACAVYLALREGPMAKGENRAWTSTSR